MRCVFFRGRSLKIVLYFWRKNKPNRIVKCGEHQLEFQIKNFKRAGIRFPSGLITIIFFQLDSATSLITAAKNLMNAVISTVKASYVANTKVWLSLFYFSSHLFVLLSLCLLRVGSTTQLNEHFINVLLLEFIFWCHINLYVSFLVYSTSQEMQG